MLNARVPIASRDCKTALYKFKGFHEALIRLEGTIGALTNGHAQTSCPEAYAYTECHSSCIPPDLPYRGFHTTWTIVLIMPIGVAWNLSPSLPQG